MKTLLWCLLSGVLSHTAVAQSRGVAAFFRAGYMHSNISEQKLAAVCSPVKSFRKHYYGIGGEAYWKKNRIFMGFDGMVATQGASSEGEFYAEPFTVNSTLKFGYAAYEISDLFLYPTVGAGAGLFGITTYVQHDHTKKDINTMYVISPSAEIGINADKFVYTFPNGKATGAFLFGIRAGYRFSIPSNDWKKVPAAEIPAVKVSSAGYFLAISLGAGNFRNLRRLPQ